MSLFQTQGISRSLHKGLLIQMKFENGPALNLANIFGSLNHTNTETSVICVAQAYGSVVIVARFRPALEYLVSPLQTTFVPKRKGVDNAIIVQELIHSISNKRGREGIMAIKIDLEKAQIVLNGALLRTLLLCLSSLATSSPLF